MKTLVCVCLCLLMLVPLFALIEPAKAWDFPYRWYAGAEIPQVLVYENYVVPLYEARAFIEVKSNTVVFGGFVAFFLCLENPSTQEWIQVGYYQNRTGFFWYSDRYVNGNYRKLIHGVAVVGETRNLKVTSVGTAYIDDSPVDSATFSPTTQPFYYGVISESNNAYNTLKGNYFELKVGLWEYDPSQIRDEPEGWIYVLKSWFYEKCIFQHDIPYYVEGIRGSGLTQVLTSGGKRMVMGGGGGRCRRE